MREREREKDRGRCRRRRNRISQVHEIAEERAIPTAGEEEAGNDVGESRLAGQSDAVVPRTRVGGMYMREAKEVESL